MTTHRFTLNICMTEIYSVLQHTVVCVGLLSHWASILNLFDISDIPTKSFYINVDLPLGMRLVGEKPSGSASSGHLIRKALRKDTVANVCHRGIGSYLSLTHRQ
jgi:hypothetical protein